jgi:hypothetical protein
MIDQKRAEESAIACAVCFSMSLKEEGPASACLWYAIAEDYAGAKTWAEKKAFNALFASAMGKYSKPSENVSNLVTNDTIRSGTESDASPADSPSEDRLTELGPMPVMTPRPMDRCPSGIVQVQKTLLPSFIAS